MTHLFLCPGCSKIAAHAQTDDRHCPADSQKPSNTVPQATQAEDGRQAPVPQDRRLTAHDDDPHAAVYNTFNTQTHLIRRTTLRQFRAAARVAWAAETQAA